MTLKHWTNNGYDSVTLHDDEDNIVGAWANEHGIPYIMYRDRSPDDWDTNGADWRPHDGIDILVAEIGEDGIIRADDWDLLRARLEFHQIRLTAAEIE